MAASSQAARPESTIAPSSRCAGFRNCCTTPAVRDRGVGALPRPGQKLDLPLRRNPHARHRSRRPRHRSRWSSAWQRHKFGMDPVEVAEKVVAAIRANPSTSLPIPSSKKSSPRCSTRCLKISRTRRPILRGSLSSRAAAAVMPRKGLCSKETEQASAARPAPTETGCGPPPARHALAGLERLHPALVVDGDGPVVKAFDIVTRDRAETLRG